MVVAKDTIICPYAQLGVTPGASESEIKRAYKEKARLWHPDKCDAPDAGDRFRAIRAAFEVLSDSTRRQAYDAGTPLGAWAVAAKRRPFAPSTFAPQGAMAAMNAAMQARAAAAADAARVGQTNLADFLHSLQSLNSQIHGLSLPWLRQRCLALGLEWPTSCLERKELITELTTLAEAELDRRVRASMWANLSKEDIAVWLEGRGCNLKYAMACDSVDKQQLIQLTRAYLCVKRTDATTSASASFCFAPAKDGSSPLNARSPVIASVLSASACFPTSDKFATPASDATAAAEDATKNPGAERLRAAVRAARLATGSPSVTSLLPGTIRKRQASRQSRRVTRTTSDVPIQPSDCGSSREQSQDKNARRKKFYKDGFPMTIGGSGECTIGIPENLNLARPIGIKAAIRKRSSAQQPAAPGKRAQRKGKAFKRRKRIISSSESSMSESTSSPASSSSQSYSSESKELSSKEAGNTKRLGASSTTALKTPIVVGTPTAIHKIDDATPSKAPSTMPTEASVLICKLQQLQDRLSKFRIQWTSENPAFDSDLVKKSFEEFENLIDHGSIGTRELKLTGIGLELNMWVKVAKESNVGAIAAALLSRLKADFRAAQERNRSSMKPFGGGSRRACVSAAPIDTL